MIPYLGCESAREMLEAFVDGELSVDDQVAVESHLRWCRTCTARVQDLSLIGSAVRIGPPTVRPQAEDRQALAAIQSGVLTRIRAERDQSFAVRVREMFSDRRLLWPGLGATAAVLVCLTGTLAAMHSTTVEHPDSLAAMLAVAQPIGQSLSPAPYVVPGGPGSDENPMGLADAMLAPRMTSDAVALESSDEEAMFAVAGVVTRQGGFEISDFVGPQTNRRGRSSREADHVGALLDAVNQSRFVPAQAQGGRRVAVNTVWLFTKITAVRDAQLEQLLKNASRPRRVERAEPPVPAVDEHKAPPAEPNGEGEQSGAPLITTPLASTTA
jgi:anti-sigma factor RsiW